MTTLPAYLYSKYQSEVETILPRLQSARDSLATSTDPKLAGIRQEIIDGQVTGNIAGLTPVPDALFLYLLVREYKPQTIFEIGTWVGTSAMFMAEALKKNGSGHIYTCDTNHYYLLNEEYADWVTYVPGHSDDVLADFITQGTTFDFMFIDGNLTRQSTKLTARTTHDKTVFAIHDYILPDDKGIQAFLRLPKRPNYAFIKPQLYRTPNKNIIINKMTATYLPTGVIPTEVSRKQGASLRLYRFYLTLSYIVGHTAKKLWSLFA